MSNSLGNRFRVTSFGESHGRCVGVVVDGCPAGLPLSQQDIQRELDRRRPGQSTVTTARQEIDKVELLSGVFNGFTTGAPICMVVWNLNIDSGVYEKMRWVPRPGHADWASNIRYGGYNDYRGGGRFSGRITAGFVMAGAIAKKLLMEALDVEILAHTSELGGIIAPDVDVDKIRVNVEKNPVRCADFETAERMSKRIEAVAGEGDSVGGVVECIVLNMPPGIGEPVFNTLEGEISKALYAIPGVKAVEFGAGRDIASLKGSQSNDAYLIKDGKIITESNNSGGILGGLSNGMPIICKVTFKPTPSISRRQKTVDLQGMKETTIEVGGFHDPCIVPRAVPVVEGMVAIVLADQALQAGSIPTILEVEA